MEGQGLHAEYRAQPQPKRILAQRPHVAVRFGSEQRARQIACRVYVMPQIQPAEIVLIEPGGESGPVQGKQQQHWQHTPRAAADFGHPLIVTYGKMKTMQPEAHEIAHVSDTALMTAACRALETERADGLIRDPFAARLAGDRGMAILRALDRMEIMCFGIAMRTRYLDQMVLDTVAAEGIGTVLSVGAGLDTRPWRLELPPALRWIEVDFPAMLDYKDGVMDGIGAKCHRERLAADLNEASGRESVFAAAGDASTLMITEGLLMYLPAATIDALAANTAVSHWILDAVSGEVARRMRMDSFQAIEKVRAAGHLDGVQILDVLRQHGWVDKRFISYSADVMQFAAERVKNMFRNVPPEQIPKPMAPGDPSGVHLFGKQSG